MVTLIFSDMHRKNPLSTIEELTKTIPVEKVVFLGDVDSADIFKEIIKFQPSKIEKLILIGNHDYPFIVESLQLGEIKKPDYFEKEFGDVDYINEVKKWRKDSVLKNFAMKYFSNLRGSDFQLKECAFMQVNESSRGKIIYCHSAIYDSKTEFLKKNQLHYQIWESFLLEERRLNEKTLRKNLLMMKEKGYSLFFRGHDHYPQVWSVKREENPINAEMHFEGNPSQGSCEIYLQPNRRYIVSVGAFIRDSYAIFDEKNFKVILVDRSVKWRGK